MRYGLLTTVAVATLSASVAAFAQGAGGSGGAGGGAGSGSSAPSMNQGAQPGGGSMNAPGATSPSRSGSSAQQNQPSESGSATRPAQQGSNPSATQGAQQQQRPGQAPAGGAAATTTGSVGADISTEQRSRITQTISRVNVPTAEVNVSAVTVGATLPSSVTLVDVPREIVEIVPAWRSYKVIRVGGRLLIVEPSSRRIVYVFSA